MSGSTQTSAICNFILMASLVCPLVGQENDQGMDNKKVEVLLKKNSSRVSGQIVEGNGSWEAYLANRTLYVLTSGAFNRIRIITPIIEENKVSDSELKTLLEANFDRALDAKFSLANGYIWSTFTHPLKELTEAQFVDALQQVVNLANNYGASYSSTDLQFGGN